jgi:hypothetical protein
MRMRCALTLVLLAMAANGQVLLNPARMSPGVLDFDVKPNDKPLRCDVRPLRPTLDFSFRFQAGYMVRVPMNQFAGKGHVWGVVVRVTPEDGAPVYFGHRTRLPEVPKTTAQLELGGGFVLGEGHYRVAWKLSDETGRVCRSEWKVEARRSHADRKVRMALAPGTVMPLYVRTPGDHHDDAPPLRLTVLLDAAPISPRRTRLSARDNIMLLGTLSALLDRLPTRSVRLVAFNLDQQKELYRQDGFTPDRLPEVAQTIESLQLGMVDYHVLQNRRGHVELLADLVNRELAEPEPSDVILFLGPLARFGERFPEQLLERTGGSAPHFFYLQYRPPFLRMQSTLPDLIHSLVSRLKGKVVVMNSPGDFEKGIQQIEHAGQLSQAR